MAADNRTYVERLGDELVKATRRRRRLETAAAWGALAALWRSAGGRWPWEPLVDRWRRWNDVEILSDLDHNELIHGGRLPRWSAPPPDVDE